METSFIFENYLVEVKESWILQGAIIVPEIKIVKINPIMNMGQD